MTKSKLDHALELAALGFYVFPITPGKKAPPLIKNWQGFATRDEQKIREAFIGNDFNIGISTSKFGDGQALLVVDVDNKGKKRGDHEILRLELGGFLLPSTRTHVTPTGGQHLLYRTDRAVKQGVDVLAPGLDIRSRGGYVVGPGSVVAAGRVPYSVEVEGAAVAVAPQWLVDRCGRAVERSREDKPAPASVDHEAAIKRARHYLYHDAPVAVEGEAGDETTYKVAARLKDFGLTQDQTVLEMLQWNELCSPPWDPDELEKKIANAYAYGRDPVGSAAPEAVFAPVGDKTEISPAGDAVQETESFTEREQLHPFERLNKEFAYVLAGGGDHVLWETTDKDGRPVLEHLSIGTFHRKHASQKMNVGKRDEKITELWMESPKRRSYDGIVFQPGQDSPPRFYNLWRGFAYEPVERYEGHPAVEDWLGHAKANVCHSDDSLFRWFVGYFANLVQRPAEKPLVAVVLRGGKGVGKNAVVERVGSLLGGHFLVTSNRRYLVGNFNGHMENLLLFALDEAFWSGDKQAEGQLKDLITGSQHVIEHKGKEPYAVDNKTRIVILGNEDWVVPASHDERRFAVFNVGDGRRQDRAFFQTMREGMERGGYRHLLRYLLDFDLTGIDVNEAPMTEGLLDQKHESLGLIEKWWLDCLHSGRIVAGDFESAFGGQVDTERFRGAFRRYAKEQGRGNYLPDERRFGKMLKKICAIIVPSRMREGGNLVNSYRLPTLADARATWDTFIGHKVEWPTE